MNMALARNRYRQAESAGHPPLDDPHQVILVTLRELDRSLGVIEAAMAAASAPPNDHVNRALTAIYILQSSLDFEKGEDIATTLFGLYEYARLQVLKVWRREEGGEISQAKEAVAQILEAWKDIRPQPPADPA